MNEHVRHSSDRPRFPLCLVLDGAYFTKGKGGNLARTTRVLYMYDHHFAFDF